MCANLMHAVLVSALFGPLENFVDLRSHLFIIHTLLLRIQYKSLLSDKPYPDLRRILMNRVYLSFKRQSKDFPQS